MRLECVLALLALHLLLYAGLARAQSGHSLVNGWNLRSVSYSLGEFYQVSATRWTEINDDGKFQFIEYARDAWSVHLRDDSRSLSIQLDLWSKKIIAKTDTPPFRQLYNIQHANKVFIVPDTLQYRVNGWSVKSVSYTGGAFVQLKGSIWVENNAAGTKSYSEISRDNWSVYLKPNDGSWWIVLDLWELKIKHYLAPDRVLHAISYADKFRQNYPTISLFFSDTSNMPGKTCITSIVELPGNYLCWETGAPSGNTPPLSVTLIPTTAPNFDRTKCNYMGGDHWMCYESTIKDNS